jgi:hypothetical protein
MKQGVYISFFKSWIYNIHVLCSRQLSYRYVPSQKPACNTFNYCVLAFTVMVLNADPAFWFWHCVDVGCIFKLAVKLQGRTMKTEAACLLVNSAHSNIVAALTNGYKIYFICNMFLNYSVIAHKMFLRYEFRKGWLLNINGLKYDSITNQKINTNDKKITCINSPAI